VLLAFGGGVAAPSANRFGRVSPTTADHVLSDLGPWLDPARDVILDGGPSPVGVESTIVDCTVAPPQVLRPGGIPTEVIEELIGPVAGASGPSRAAGMLASHYAPVAVVHLVDARPAADDLAVELIAAGRHPVIVDGTGDLVGFARTLYADLRRADDAGATDVVAVRPPAVGLGHAIRDRLTKAAHPT
jgi:L-threonylcarbamoyladenylate synthase